MPPEPSQPRGLLVSSDLFFGSKVTGTAGQLGLVVEMAGSPADALQRLAADNYACVILDLSTPGLDVAQITAALAMEKRPTVIAFGPHVETAALQAARDDGCDEVLPRSRFSAELPALLQRAFGRIDDRTLS